MHGQRNKKQRDKQGKNCRIVDLNPTLSVMDQRHIFKGRDYQDGDFFKKQDSLMYCVQEYKCQYFIYKDRGFKYTNKKNVYRQYV